MSVDGFQSVRVTDDNVFAVSSSVILYDSHFARPCGADGIANIDLDVKPLVGTTPAATEVARDDTAWRRHMESTQVDAVFLWKRGHDVYARCVPAVVKFIGGHLDVLLRLQAVEYHGVYAGSPAVDGGLARDQVLCCRVLARQCHDCC